MSIAHLYLPALGVMSAIYGMVLLGFVRGMRKLGHNRVQRFIEWPSVSVIVPARNESEVLQRTLLSLLEQDYPGAWEVVVVDDRSTDGTVEILKEMSAVNGRLRFLTVTEPHPPSPKKNALALGIRESEGEIIVTTDADCVYDRGWLRSMVSHMTPEVGVVAGLTVFDLPTGPVPAWQKIQWLDFVAQQYLAAGAAGAGVPSSCNGSNLAYRRSVYREISGFGRSAEQVSGDDVLFAQRVSKRTKWKVAFNTARASIVRSLPVPTVRDVFYQRIRWASKGFAYRRSMSVFLLGMYLYYAMWMAAPVAAMAAPALLPALLAIALWKTGWDYLTLRVGCGIFGQRSLLRYFLPFVVLHVTLSPVFGAAGLFVPYRWKGEWYRTATLPRGLKRSLVRVRRLVRPRRAAEAA
jgi:cellulose synthase/poly-beta-1,6-N-acetylglucosamine synthase-like glycosyltransferase